MTMEMDPERAREARANFARAGLADRVSVIVGDARADAREGRRAVRSDFSGRRQAAVLAAARSARRAAAAGRPARDRQRAVGRRGRARVRRRRRRTTATTPERSPNTTSASTAHPQLITATVPLRDGVAISVKRRSDADDDSNAWLEAAAHRRRRAARAARAEAAARSAGAARPRRCAPPTSTTTRRREPAHPVSRAPRRPHDDHRRIRPEAARRRDDRRAVTEECLERIDADNARLNAFILVMADEARRQARDSRPRARRRPRSRPAARRADFDQGSARHPRHADDRRLARARRPRRRPRCAGHRASAAGRRGVRRQDQPARVRVRHDERGLGVRAGAQSARSDAVARRLERRIGGQRGGRHGAGDDRHRYRRLDPRSRPPPAASSASSRRSARSRPTASCRCRARSITSVRSTQTVADAWLVYHALLGDAAAAPPAPMPMQRSAAGGAAPVFLRSAGRRGAGAVRSGARTPARRWRARRRDRHSPRDDVAAVYLHIFGCRCGGLSRGDARDDARAVHAERAAAAGDGAIHAGRRLRARARPDARCYGARSTRRWRITTRSCCRRCRFRLR